MGLLNGTKPFIYTKVESRYFALHSPGKEGPVVVSPVPAPLPSAQGEVAALKNGMYLTGALGCRRCSTNFQSVLEQPLQHQLVAQLPLRYMYDRCDYPLMPGASP